MHLPARAVAQFRQYLFAAGCAGLFSATPTASAVDKYWANLGTDFNLTTNWFGGLPGTSDRAIFGTPVAQPILSGPMSINGATFFAPGTTLSGVEPLTLLSNTTNNDLFASLSVASPGVTTISAPLVLGAPAATGNAGFTAILGGELRVSGDISGSRGIQKMSYGTVTLSGNNSFTGGVQANGGNGNFGITRLNINSDTALGTGTLSVGQGNGGSTIGNTSGAARTLANAINLGAGGGLTSIFDLPANGSGDLTFTGAAALSGAASQAATVNVIGGTLTLRAALGETAATQSLVKNGSGTLVLGGAVSNTGAVTFSGGAVVLDASTGGAFANATLPLALTNTNFSYKGAGTGASAQTMSGTAALNGRTGISVDGNGGAGATLTLSNTWTRNAASTLAITLAGNATLSASPAVSGGGLVVGSGFAAFATVKDSGGTGFATFEAGNVVRYTAANTMTTIDSGSSTNYITKVGDADYVGDTLTLSAGNRAFNTLHLDTTGGAGVLDLNGTTLSFTDRGLLATGGNSFTVQNGVFGAAVELVVHQFSTGALTVSSLIGGVSNNVASLTKDGLGTLVIAGNNLYTNATTANEGTIRITGSVKGNVVASGSTVASSGTVILENASAVTQNTVTVSGVGTLNQTVANAIGGSAAVTVNGFFRGATANLSMANNYSGNTTLSNGFLNIGDPAAIGTGTLSIGGGVLDNTSGAAMTLANNNAVTFTGGVVFAGTRSLNLGTGAINLGTSPRTIVIAANTLTFGGSASGTGGITKAGPGTLTLGNANTYGGATDVQGGILLLNNATALPGGIGSAGGLANLTLSGGVIGLGAGDFTRGVGTGAEQVRWTNIGGFAAFGADRIVNLGGSAATLTWNSSSFLTGQTGNPAIFVLGAPSADKMVDFQNPIILAATGTNTRVVQVDDGAAPIDAKLSGAISSTGTSTTFTKIGNGTLTLSGAQTYNVLNTNAGTTNLDNTLGTGTSTLNANADTNIHASQTLAALNIADGAIVTLGGPVAPFSEDAGGGLAATGVVAVPEPGSALLLFAGLGALVGRRKRA